MGALLLAAGWQAAAAQGNKLRITYINVGQGDSALVQGPDGYAVLIDGGPAAAAPTVLAVLAAQGVSDLDVIVASHNDADHIAGLVDILGQPSLPVGEVWFNGYPADSETYRQFATAAANAGAPLQAVQYPADRLWGAAQVTILNPPANLSPPFSQNNASLVALLRYGGQQFLFTGDIEQESEAQILLRGDPLAAAALKVAHHGSDTSTSPEFLAAVGPSAAILSVGANNSFGQPDPEVVARLQAAGAELWRTDQNGTIWLESDGAAYQVWAELMHPVRLPLVFRSYCNPGAGLRLAITTIFYDGTGREESDEFVELTNPSGCPLQLGGWQLRDDNGLVYTFPAFIINPGQVCRIYTNETHPEWCGFNWGRGSPVWNNAGECGLLWDPQGKLEFEYCY